MFKAGGFWFKRLAHSRVPIVLGTVVAVPWFLAMWGWMKGPIVR